MYKSHLSKRKADMGLGRKFDYTKDLAKAPASNLYNANNYYNALRTKGTSFGLSREHSPDRSYLIPQIHCHPGPTNVLISLFSTTTRRRLYEPLNIAFAKEL